MRSPPVAEARITNFGTEVSPFRRLRGEEPTDLQTEETIMPPVDRSIPIMDRCPTVVELIGEDASLDDFSAETRAELLGYALDWTYDALDGGYPARRAHALDRGRDQVPDVDDIPY